MFALFSIKFSKSKTFIKKTRTFFFRRTDEKREEFLNFETKKYKS